VLVGAASINVLATGNTTLQLRAAPELRGRVMALWAVAFLGTTPVGGPIIGYIGEHAGPRVGLAVGGSAALVAAVVGWWFLVRPAAGAGGRSDDEAEESAGRLVAAAAPAGR
jgi:MFS family permease